MNVSVVRMRNILVTLCFLVIFTEYSSAQNYLTAAYENALFLHNTYESKSLDLRKSLDVTASDFGYYYTEALASAIERSTSVAHGAGLQSCAAVAARSAQQAINGFDDHLQELQDESMRLHISVIQQLMESNIKTEEFNIFYYNHSTRMNALYKNLTEVKVPEIYEYLYELWAEYFVILGHLETCIDLVFWLED